MRRRPVLDAILLLVVVAGSSLVLPEVAAAQAEPTAAGGTIAGTVTSETNGAPLAGIRVKVYATQEWAELGKVAATARTAGDGTYAVTGLPAGWYLVAFADVDGVAPDHATEYYASTDPDAPTWLHAERFLLGGGETRTGIDVALAPAAVLEGRVTDQTTGAPLAGIRVRVYVHQWYDPLLAGTITGPDGRYRFSGLPGGDHAIAFSDEDGIAPRYATQYHTSRAGFLPGPNASTPLPMPAGTVTTLDQALVPGGTITGRVVDDATGLPRAGIRVRVWAGPELAAADDTDADGVYVLEGLHPYGAYYVGFSPAYPTRLEYYDDARRFRDADPVAVPLGATVTGVDAGLGSPPAP